MFPETNLSNEPLSEEYMRTRNKMEPLIEMMQIKGNSEIHPKFWINVSLPTSKPQSRYRILVIGNLKSEILCAMD